MERRSRHKAMIVPSAGEIRSAGLAPGSASAPCTHASPAERRLDPTRACHQRPYANKENGQRRTRTADTTIFSRVLYQLSYLAATLDAICSTRLGTRQMGQARRQ
jgi:hypothetical protein